MANTTPTSSTPDATKPEATVASHKEAFEVYCANLAKLTPDGKGDIPSAPPRMETHATLELAQKFAKDRSTEFDRVTLIHRIENDGKLEQKLIERYSDGKFERADEIVRR